ncbi:uncharacterized protein LOC124949040 [Vespa velutina]|uniref:uncharacterized protein LOC124949040 n=1 Tax=Vespa velutina TaxID=202808 RepID=UPI001FB1D55A|nr:uncharacterized protein LOC124949040 [Vespa velutina]
MTRKRTRKGTHKEEKKKRGRNLICIVRLSDRDQYGQPHREFFSREPRFFANEGDENKEKRDSQSRSSIRKTRQAKLCHRSYGLVLSHDSNVYGTPPRKSLLLTRYERERLVSCLNDEPGKLANAESSGQTNPSVSNANRTRFPPVFYLAESQPGYYFCRIEISTLGWPCERFVRKTKRFVAFEI